MPELLTKRKSKWRQQFKPKVLRGAALNPNISAAIRYQSKLDKLIVKMTTDVRKQLTRLFNGDAAEEYFAQDASIASQARILTNALIKKWESIFDDISKPYAEQVVNEADASSTTALHISLKDLSGGLSLKTSALSAESLEVFNASITENVALIKSIPAQYLGGVQQAVMRSITSGQGMADLIPYLQKHEGITKRRATVIAYDQTRKAFNGLNRSKMQRLGIKEFEWLHSGGSNEPRKDHIEMSGKIYSFDDPPEIDRKTGQKGFPGDLVSCRCRMKPVIKFNEE